MTWCSDLKKTLLNQTKIEHYMSHSASIIALNTTTIWIYASTTFIHASNKSLQIWQWLPLQYQAFSYNAHIDIIKLPIGTLHVN